MTMPNYINCLIEHCRRSEEKYHVNMITHHACFMPHGRGKKECEICGLWY
jgi:hypothetical protein